MMERFPLRGDLTSGGKDGRMGASKREIPSGSFHERELMMFLFWNVLVVLMLSGCASLFGSGQTLSAEQITAMGKDKNANAICITASGPWGKAITTYVVVDKSVLNTGTFGVDTDCKVTMQNEKQVIQQVVREVPAPGPVSPLFSTVPR